MTNAHVVAGEASTRVQSSTNAMPARAVFFDPKTDLAVLFVPSLHAPALRLDRSEVPRGAQGAAIGHPGGGPLTAVAAGVRRPLNAVGRDIYGRSVIARRIYELQAVVRPGDSGGPFVLKDGQVAGVVFAASTTDPNVGYALITASILSMVRGAVGRTAAVSTGPCAR